jgi:hypothetical protein
VKLGKERTGSVEMDKEEKEMVMWNDIVNAGMSGDGYWHNLELVTH